MKTRREFIRATSAAAILSPTLLRGASDNLGNVLPQRPFGPKGEKVTAFGLGGYHVGLAKKEKTAEALIEKAIERGVRFFDNAVRYQKGLSETYYGKFLSPKYRDQVFITPKTGGQNAKSAKKELEDSLRRLNTDRIDLWQMHAFTGVSDVKKRIKGGVVDLFLEMREKKMARYIGFTGHSSQEAHCYFLDFCKQQGYQMDSCLMPVNIADPNYDSFIVNVLPKLLEQNVSLLAMKTMIFGRIFKHFKKVAPGTLTPKNLHEFVYSMPITTLLSGCETVAQVDQNIDILENYQPMPEAKRNELTTAVEKISGKDLEYYKRNKG